DVSERVIRFECIWCKKNVEQSRQPSWVIDKPKTFWQRRLKKKSLPMKKLTGSGHICPCPRLEEKADLFTLAASTTCRVVAQAVVRFYAEILSIVFGRVVSYNGGALMCLTETQKLTKKILRRVWFWHLGLEWHTANLPLRLDGVFIRHRGR